MNTIPSELLDSVRRHLEEEKTKISARIEELNMQDPFSDPARVNDKASNDTEASVESSHDRFLALVDELTNERSAIDAALLRIRNGTYGFCASCGKLIDTDRLSILPTATLCVDCERKKKKSAS